MSEPLTHVFVTAAEGRLVPVPMSEATAAGAEVLKIEPGKIYRLPWSTYTRRRITAGDLILTNERGTKVTKPEDARASIDTKLEPDGTISKDQRPDEVVEAEHSKAAELEAKKAAHLPHGKDR